MAPARWRAIGRASEPDLADLDGTAGSGAVASNRHLAHAGAGRRADRPGPIGPAGRVRRGGDQPRSLTRRAERGYVPDGADRARRGLGRDARLPTRRSADHGDQSDGRGSDTGRRPDSSGGWGRRRRSLERWRGRRRRGGSCHGRRCWCPGCGFAAGRQQHQAAADDQQQPFRPPALRTASHCRRSLPSPGPRRSVRPSGAADSAVLSYTPAGSSAECRGLVCSLNRCGQSCGRGTRLARRLLRCSDIGPARSGRA